MLVRCEGRLVLASATGASHSLNLLPSGEASGDDSYAILTVSGSLVPNCPGLVSISSIFLLSYISLLFLLLYVSSLLIKSSFMLEDLVSLASCLASSWGPCTELYLPLALASPFFPALCFDARDFLV